MVSQARGILYRAYHLDDLGVDMLVNHATLCRNVIEQLMQCRSFNLLALEVGTRVVPIEQDSTLP